jgi:hypothetical protein
MRSYGGSQGIIIPCSDTVAADAFLAHVERADPD